MDARDQHGLGDALEATVLRAGHLFVPEQAVIRHEYVVERQLEGVPSVVADLADGRPGTALGELARLLVRDEPADSLMPAGGVIGRRASDHEDSVGLVGERAPHLLSVDHPTAVDLVGPGTDGRDV